MIKATLRNAGTMDLRDCLSFILGIYRALQVLYIDPHLADQWLSKPNTVFGGRSALEHMLGGSIIDLAAVRAYLDSVLGGK